MTTSRPLTEPTRAFNHSAGSFLADLGAKIAAVASASTSAFEGIVATDPFLKFKS